MILLGTSSSRANTSLPDFYQHPINESEQFTGVPETVDLSSYKGAQKYRTKLKEGARKGPNFAGHYTIVTIGCGTECQENWLIDTQTGKILTRIHSMIGLKYQLDSALMIINPIDPELARRYKSNPDAPVWNGILTSYVLWKDNKFDRIFEDKWVNIINSNLF